MKMYLSIILLLILTIFCGIWLDNTLPNYGKALGLGIGLAYALGLFTKKLE